METSSSTGTLPRTGVDISRLVLTGLVLIAAGSVLRVRVTRRGL